MSQNPFAGDGRASDFLGLDEGVAPATPTTPTTPAELLQPQVPAPEEAYEPEAAYDEAALDFDQGAEESEPELYEEDGGEESDAVHTSWVEPASPVRSRGILAKLVVAMVLGMAGTTALFVMQQEGVLPQEAMPLAPELNTTPGFEQRILEQAPAETSARARAQITRGPGAGAAVAKADPPATGDAPPSAPPGALDTGPADQAEAPASSTPLVAEAAPVPELATEPETEPAAEVEPAVAALIPIWRRVGETLPPGVPAEVDAAPEPAPAGALAVAESADEGQAAAGDPPAAESEAGVTTFVVVGDDTGTPGLEEHAYWDEFRGSEEFAAESLGEPSSEPGEPPSEGAVGTAVAAPEPAPGKTAEIVASLDGWTDAVEETTDPAPTTDAEETTDATDTTLAAETTPPTAAGPGVFGPALPSGVQAPAAVPPAEAELSVNTRVRRIETAQVVQPDQRGPRLATEAELKGVWLKEEVPPMLAIDQPQKLLTPQVGQVRVILHGNEIFQGRLYAMGEGRVWINNERFGQMGLEGAKVQRIARIVGDDSTPLPGQKGSQDLGGLESVRIKTASGGILVGKVIARDELKTTLVTQDGTSVTFSSDQIQFLDEAPEVSLKRSSPKPPAVKPAVEPPATEPAAAETAQPR